MNTYLIIAALTLSSDATIRFEPSNAGVEVWLDWTVTVNAYQVIITDPAVIDAFVGGIYSDAFPIHPGGDTPHLHDFNDSMDCLPDLILTLDGGTMLDLPPIGMALLAVLDFGGACHDITASCVGCFGSPCTFDSTAAAEGIAVETELVPGSTCSTEHTCDFTGDGCVGIDDFLWVLGHWSSGQVQPMGIAELLCVLGNWGCP